MYITLEQLKKAGACNEQLLEFERIFGNKARLTRANLYKAVSEGFGYSDIAFLCNLVLRLFETNPFTSILCKYMKRPTDLTQDYIDTICEYYKLK